MWGGRGSFWRQPKGGTAEIQRRAEGGVAVRNFFGWLDRHGIGALGAIRTHHVSTYIETLTHEYRAPTVKQHLTALRMLFDWLIVGQIVEQNPAAAVRGPKHVVKKGKTPVLDGDEAKKLLDSITLRIWVYGHFS
jgi:site-specific recombinase XerD